jgi:iron complex outermembrane receptor protein
MGVVYDILDGMNLGLWVGRAQRSGSLTERYINYFPVGLDPYEMIGNPELKPEVNNQADLNFRFKREHAILDASLFVSYLQDFISSEINDSLEQRMPSSPGVKQYINLDRAVMAGMELSWGQKLIAGLQHELSIAFTYGQDLFRQEPLPEIAPFDARYILSGSYFNSKLSPELSFRYVAAQNRISSAYGETETASFNILDLGVSWEALKMLNVSAKIQNVFDVAYYEHLSRSVRGDDPRPIYAPGRSAVITVSIGF